jgi:hypothetical protein
LLEIDLFEDPEGEIFHSMKVPGGLKRLVRLDTLPQRERAAGPDRGKIGRRRPIARRSPRTETTSSPAALATI